MLPFFRVLTLVGLTLGAEFSYDRCDKKEGPAYWGGFCQNTTVQQTPINLCGATTMSTMPTMTALNYNVSQVMPILNNGHTLQLNQGSGTAPTLQVGNLAQMVGRGSNTTTQTWVFAQVHLHWGRTGKINEGSEHYLQGIAYPLEAHLVHYNAQYGSVGNAVGQPDGLLVVGYFFQVGSSTPNLIKQIALAATQAKKDPQAITPAVTLTDIFPGTGSYYSYGGSLTTPGCNPVVTWIVFTQILTITQSDLDLIKQASTTPPSGGQSIAVYGNFRPLQKQPSTLYIVGGSSAACTAVTEPVFTCSLGFGSNPSIFVHMAAMMFATYVLRH